MRARYAAYARGDASFVQATTDPDGPQWEPDAARWRASIEAFHRGTRFVSLEILNVEPAHVTFRAGLEQGGRDASFTERSRFTQRGARWYYHGRA
jgi:SEC-C motif-containing protein